jgi:hypothetical protein
MSCLSTASNPCDVIFHILCNKNLYGNVVRSIQKSRNAREIGGLYCLFFQCPCNKKSVTLRGERILEIYERSCNICWCNDTERIAGLTILNADFFADVLGAFTKANTAKNEVKEFCKNFNIPGCLFPNVPVNERSFTISGKKIIELACRAMSNSCCENTC